MHCLTSELCLSVSTRLLFAALDLSLLLAGEELADLLVPAQRPLIDHGKVSRVRLESVIDVPAEPLAHT